MSAPIRIGLLSDTHCPQRLAALPASLAHAFANVTALLHAGDVGELWVLDELSHIAPTTAVHGNDDTADAQRELPYQQLITLNGLRLLLWHSHFPNRAEEMASRRGDDIGEKLERSIQAGKRAQAQLVIFGHWHIPLIYEKDGITVVNPGALASGNFITRQTIQTVALLEVDTDGRFQIQHRNLAQPHQPYHLPTQLERGFVANANLYQDSLLDDELQPHWQTLWRELFPLAYKPLVDFWLRLAHQCWAGQRQRITAKWLREELAQDETIPTDVKTAVLQQLDKRNAPT